MKFAAFSIYDSKAEAFSPPFFQPSVGLAIRAFEDMCRDESHPIGKHAGDYELFRLGVFDDSDGSYVGELAPVALVAGRSVTAREPLKVSRA